MKNHNHISSDIALLIVLAIVVSLIIFPVLDNMPLSDAERNMLAALASSTGPGTLSQVFTSGASLFDASYIRFVALIQGLVPWHNDILMLRLPGALIVLGMTLCLFRFDGGFDRLSTSFLASLVFLSSMIVSQVTFRAAPILIPSALFIFAMMCLYHWLHHRSKRYYWLVVLSTSAATILIGATAPIAIAVMAYVFIAAAKSYPRRSYFVIGGALLMACAVAFMSIYVLVGDSSVAISIFHVRQQMESLALIDEPFYYVFAKSIVWGLFPWSLPLLISLPWLARNPQWVITRFKRLDLLQRFGIIIFLFSLPLLMLSTELSRILLVTAIFFNAPLIGRYLMLQFNHHPAVWRITGAICATIIGLGTSTFVAVQAGMAIDIFGHTLERNQGWSAWSIFLTVSIVVGLYSLWRNVREIGNNNRYLYNIILLYLLAVALTTGYIIGSY